MKHTFIYEGGYPQFYVDHEQLLELGGCSPDYVIEIVTELEKVLCGERAQYDFGREVYSIDCDKDTCKVLNTFENWQEELTIPTAEMYELMKAWRDFSIK